MDAAATANLIHALQTIATRTHVKIDVGEITKSLESGNSTEIGRYALRLDINPCWPRKNNSSGQVQHECTLVSATTWGTSDDNMQSLGFCWI